MADFNLDVGGVPNAAPPIQPVEDNSAANGIASLNNLFGDIGNVAKRVITTNNANEATEKSQRILNGIRENLLIKDDAVAQNQWSSQAAGSAVRRQLASDLANHPGLTKEIMDVYKDTLGNSVLGGAITNGTQQEKDRHDSKMKIWNDAVSAGVVPAGLNPDDPRADDLLEQFQGYRLHTTQIEQTSKELALKRAQIGLQTDVVQLAGAKQNLVTGAITQKTAKLNLAEKQAEVQSRVALTGAASTYHNMLSKKLAATYADWKAGKISAQEATLQIDQDTAQVQAIATQGSPDAGGDYIKNTLAPMVSLASSFKEAVTGKIDADAMQNQLNATTNKAILMQIHNDPQSVGLIAALKVFDHLPLKIAEEMTSQALKNIGWNGDTGKYEGSNLNNAIVGPNPNGAGARASSATQNSAQPVPNLITADRKDIKATIGFIKGAMENVLGGIDKSPESVAEINNALNTTARSTIKYGKAAEGSKDYNEVIDLLASPTFAAYMKSGKFRFKAGEAQTMADMMLQSYQRDVVPLIQKEFIDGKVSVGIKPLGGSELAQARGLVQPDMRQSTGNIKATFDGKGIRFVPNDPNNPTVSAEAQRLTRLIKPSFDRFITAQSNLSGKPVKEEYEDYMASILPEPEAASE